jgi:hypothetical protein
MSLQLDSDFHEIISAGGPDNNIGEMGDLFAASD